MCEASPKSSPPAWHLLAENDDTTYIAYVSEQNLLTDESGKPLPSAHTRPFHLQRRLSFGPLRGEAENERPEGNRMLA